MSGDFPPAIPPRPKPPNGGQRGSSQAATLAMARAAAKPPKGIKPIKVGRPLSYHPALCDIAVEIGASGRSFASIAAAFGISRSRLYEWGREFPAFEDALSRARDLSQAWWETHGQGNLKADRYQAQVWAKTMSARFEDYRENKALDVLAGAAADWLTAITELSAERANKARPVDAQVIENKDKAPDLS